ncbi:MULTISPECIES: hypothetical protein [Halolamina]|uniref:Uncharacterized protein n=1 Tax=Halolamina pelagica TaxID=699431 RepID=A0A1I5VJ17_9EURY|nr:MULTISPECIES: hypothetical protein [Halolamina]NHX37647.1 hypothetical protein [Halolamina sp. R1-12]SFQ07463.1 hypothetical protein SAMN05216277_11829 [Halolamina pelagica]
MSRGERFAQFNAAARSFFEADVGPVNPSVSCGVEACDEAAVYRVPWHSVGGDITYCGYHLARYRELHPDLFERVQEAVDEDLSALATRGARFLTFDEVPEQLYGEAFVAIALLATGHALYEEADPDEIVEYRTVDRRLQKRSSTEAARERAGEFLQDVEQRLGVHEWSDDALAALYGGETA